MNLNRPLLVVPKENVRVDSKTGGGKPPKYMGETANFQSHKRSRVQDLDAIITETRKDNKPVIASPDGEVFFEIEFHEKALSKSAQPRKLLEASNIDIFSQKSDKKFFASAKVQSLNSFKEKISNLSLETDKNDSAYLSAITRIEPISREDKLGGALSKTEGEVFIGFLYLPDTLSVGECGRINEQISEDQKQSSSFFVSTAGSKIIYGSFTSGFIDQISEPDPRIPIQKIERSLEFTFPQEMTTKYEYDDVEVLDIQPDASVAVVDTGISDGQLHLTKFLIDTEDFIKDAAKEDRSHGTFVAGRVVFGHDAEGQIRMEKKLVAKAKVLDVKVMKKGVGASDFEILSAIANVLENPKYSELAIFNLSLNYENPEDVLAGKKHYFTRELDAIANKYGVIFVISAGNYKLFVGKTYPDYLFEGEACITTPADSINNISVGSVADVESSRSIAKEGEPSPFSRSGVKGMMKPDVAHYGGNVDGFGSYAGVGVKGFGMNQGDLTENVGTSFAAPLVSQVASQIHAFVNGAYGDKLNASNLTKALLVHSAIHPKVVTDRLDQEQAHRMMGFGIPDFEQAVSCAKSAASFIHVGAIGKLAETADKPAKESKHRMKIIVPPELEGKNKRVKISCTLVYTPPVSESGEVDYSLVDIELNLHRINKNGKLDSATLTKGNHDYRNKWNPVKHFEKIFTAYKGGDWEVWLTLTTRGRLDQKTYDQPYALIITVEDVSSDEATRVDVHQVVREQYRSYVPIEVRERVRIS